MNVENVIKNSIYDL